MNVQGKVAVVTGGAVRVGKEIALALGREGANVVVHYHTSSSEARRTVKTILKLGSRALAARADLTKSAQVDRLRQLACDEFGRIDILINNAAVFPRTPFAELTEDDWDFAIDSNLKSVFLCCKAFGDVMLAQQSGCIVNLADVAGLRPWANYLPYSVSKAGVIALTQGLAKALAPHVRVNAVAPGAVMWPQSYTDADKKKRLAKVPLGRVGSPEEVARTVLFLIESDYITGAVVPVDGGRSLV